MSYAPSSLLDLRDYVKRFTGLSDNALGIVGDANHTGGYHLGRDRLKSGDYSIQHTRDRNGLTNAASAIDIGSFAGLVELTAHLLAEARTGRANDIREIIGPYRDGRAYRWDRLNTNGAFVPVIRAKGDSHEWHVHVSYFRDSENRTKIPPYKSFFERATVAITDADVEKIATGLIVRNMGSPSLGITKKPVGDWWKDAHENQLILVRHSDKLIRLEDGLVEVSRKLDTIGQPTIDYPALARAIVDEFHARNTTT